MYETGGAVYRPKFPMPDKIPGVTVSQRLAGGFNMRVDESADAMTESQLASKTGVSIAGGAKEEDPVF